MPEIEIICLANSRKYSGRCIAGLRTDGQGWIRPVGWTTDGGLTPNNYHLDNDSEPRVLDVIRLSVARPHAKPHHPEDWIMGPSQWRLIERPAEPARLNLLRDSLVRGPALFGDTRAHIPAAQFKMRPSVSSLALIEPENLRWLVEESKGKRRVTARFTLCGAFYSLRLTDPIYEQKLEDAALGLHPRRAAGVSDTATVWLTVSLGEPFAAEPGAAQSCYKIAAAVIVLPGSEPGEISPILPQKELQTEMPSPDARPKSKGKAALQTVYGRNYEPWSEAEDERLIVMVKSGMTASAIASLLQRSESAVVGRIGKLVLEKYRNLL